MYTANAPADMVTAFTRYKKMGDALANRPLGVVKALAGELAAHDCVVLVLKFRT
jgi:hypothetical protein